MAELLQIDTSRMVTRVALFLTLVLAFVVSTFGIRAYVGSTMAEYLSSEEGGLEMPRRAVAWAPRDPHAHWKLGAIMERKLPADQLPQALAEFEKAASLSPNDYRFWMDFGTALEQAGEVERAEKVLRRSVELAPSYAYPRWYLGNLFLRSGRYPEAFAELRRASEADPTFQPQLFNSAWAVYSDDIQALTSAVGSTGTARAGFAQYLIGFQRFDDGIRLWKSLNENERRANREAGEAIVKSLVASQRYHQAADVSNDLAPASVHSAEGKFVDGGFESGLGYREGSIFGWKVTSTSQAQIGIDPAQGYQSERSLRLLFQVRTRLDAVNVSQLIPIAPDTTYELEYAVKTQKLDSADLPTVAVFDEVEGKLLVKSEEAPGGSSDWKVVKLSFKTGPKTQAITIRLQRTACAPEASCPIYGTVWYDNFNLQRRG
ncbi:MAG TPA: tetratricopeptide repeat protein [Pyrinomonadaceae bacterium]|nr:tetratricopeptide repeat protein [Pyrinomonadaceae bacterium]